MKLLVLCALAAVAASDSSPDQENKLAAVQALTQLATSRSDVFDTSRSDVFDTSRSDYDYGYSVKDPYSGVDINAEQQRLGQQTHGSYGTILPDGRRQVVNYVADNDSGYQADVQYYGVAQHPRTTPTSYYNRGQQYNRGHYYNQRNYINHGGLGGRSGVVNQRFGVPHFTRIGHVVSDAGINGFTRFNRLGHLGFRSSDNLVFGGPNSFSYNSYGGRSGLGSLGRSYYRVHTGRPIGYKW